MTQPDTTDSLSPSSSSSETRSASNLHPDVASDRLLGNFISLFDAIEAVACRVEIADGTVDAYRDTSDDINAFAITLNRWPIKTGFQKSAAATLLIQHLANGPAHDRPRWFDITLGFPLVRDVVAEEGMTELARIVRWAENHKRWYSSLRWQQSSTDKAEDTSPAFELLPRVRQIGFDRGELIRFLDRNRIGHCLRATADTKDQEGASQSNELTKSLASAKEDLSHDAGEKRGQGPSKAAQQGQQKADVREPGVSDARAPQFRGVLADILLQAWENAGRRRNKHALFAEVVKLARQKPLLHPLIGASDDGHNVKYHDQNGTLQDFTIVDMESRMRAIPKSDT